MLINLHVGWPQGIMMALWLISLGINAAKHGQCDYRTYDFRTTVCAVTLMALLLYWGGFFG